MPLTVCWKAGVRHQRTSSSCLGGTPATLIITALHRRSGGGLQPRDGCSAHLPSPGAQQEPDHEVKCLFFSLLIPFRGYQTHMDWKKEEGDPYPYFVYGAACSEVEIDCLTGAHKVKRAICVHQPHSVDTNTDMFPMLSIIINLIPRVEEPGTDIGRALF